MDAHQPPMHAQSSIRSFFSPKATSVTSPDKCNGSSLSASPPPPPPPPASMKVPPPPSKYAPPPSQAGRIAQPSTIVPAAPAQRSVSTPHPQATISTFLPEHIQPLRRINSLLLPIAYPDSFYHKILDPATSPNFCRAILWTDTASSALPNPVAKVIGGIVCRLDLDPATQECAIYVQSLALLSPYRTFGLATAAINEVIRYAVEQKIEPCPITSLYAHVWTENEDGLKWYGKQGFVREGSSLNGYYRRLQPDSAWVLRRNITPSDHLRQNGVLSSTQEKALPLLSQKDVNEAQSTTTSSSSISSAPPTSSGRPSLAPPNGSSRAASYQTMRPATEWNDLPSDILVPSRPTSTRPSPSASQTNLALPELVAGSAPSSRSSSMTRDGIVGSVASGPRGKKKRVYPAAAFEGPK